LGREGKKRGGWQFKKKIVGKKTGEGRKMDGMAERIYGNFELGKLDERETDTNIYTKT
jgi:hypothetical protein